MNESVLHRRDALKMAVGLGLSFMVPGLSPRLMARRGKERPKSLVLIWLEGGPSQLETWDPHPGSKVGGPTKAIRTSIPGVEIADHFPQMAEQLKHVSVIRSLVSKEGDHQRGSYFVRTGFRPDPTIRHPSVGSVVKRELPCPELEIPAFVSLGYTSYPSRGGYLGGEHDAFQARNPGTIDPTFRAGVSKERLKRRMENLDVVSRAFARGRGKTVERTIHKESVASALKLMTSEQLKAFEIKDESHQTRMAYGDSSFGRGCLVARRLIEQGARVVEVTLNGFDTHENNFQQHRQLAQALDPAMATLLQELSERNLLESTAVLCIGEFGRTPRINPKSGRDHWPNAFSCLIGGGGIKGGQVLGSTDPTGEKKEPKDKVELFDLYATLFQALGIRHDRERMTRVGRPMKYSDGKPLLQLL